MVVVNRVYNLGILSLILEYFIFNSIYLFFFFCRALSGDFGIDIFGSYQGYILIVQCKAYTTENVGRDEIRAFEGTLLR